MPQPANRLEQLPAYPFAALNQRVRAMNAQGLDIISLDVGSPDQPPPDQAVAALAESARNPKHHGYSGYKGTAEYREAVARYYQRRFGVSLDPEREILPLLGSKEGIVNLSLAYLDIGDLSLVPDPSYPAYAMGARLAGAEIHWLPLDEANDHRVDLAHMSPEVASRAKMLWVNYPNNPTGATIGLEDYRQLVAFCAAHDILLASDNPYVDVTWDGYSAESPLQIDGALEHTVEFMSLSKTYNMAGWRLGAAIGSAQAIQALLQVKSNFDSGHFRAVYDAGIAVLNHVDADWIAARNHVYQQRRDRLMAALPQIGLRAQPSKGSLYLWACVDQGDGLAYAEAALTGARVSLAPGGFYGASGSRHVRISLGVPDERFDEAIDRLKTWYSSR
ncbi:MAG: aminotransferase class I/II-fold pyridoxal phosphate-dependent enzyme [Chloroflexi bacterium]|nr:aminotransferase class I/II-fold pyridoxal phosphate-dependent enzyme [Chloroflexota bacterium]